MEHSRCTQSLWALHKHSTSVRSSGTSRVTVLRCLASCTVEPLSGSGAQPLIYLRTSEPLWLALSYPLAESSSLGILLRFVSCQRNHGPLVAFTLFHVYVDLSSWSNFYDRRLEIQNRLVDRSTILQTCSSTDHRLANCIPMISFSAGTCRGSESGFRLLPF